ncbi:DUF1302 domain-containing protein [Metapseudomonas furukawaii]|uniref:DUF1302 domain-containing protein n=1 Tax=Metapseudomonas furukawaii TaxID=1149133 RepID=UPI004045E9BB
MKTSQFKPTGSACPRSLKVAITLAIFGATQAHAFEIDTGIPDLSVRWDNTLKYSVGWRLEDRKAELSTLAPAAPNQNDGNNNFDQGSLIQNRLDIFSEFDAKYKNVGLRVSGAAWYDNVYQSSNDNDTLTANRPVGEPANEFSSETARLMGRDAELLDAFVYGQFSFDERPVTVRAGSHTVLFGESLFFANNAIAGGQGPVDAVKARSVPGSTTKEILQPTGKVSVQASLTDGLSVGAYLGYEWEKNRLPPIGSYLATSDSVGPGAERVFAGNLGSFTVIDEKEAKDSGQGGISLRYYSEPLDTDFGFHAIRYHATGPSGIYTRWAGLPGRSAPLTFQEVYHEGIEAYGISANRTFGNVNFGAEFSIRDNTPLASTGLTIFQTPAGVVVNGNFDNNDNPGYAVGRTAHANLNWLASLRPNWLADETSLAGEIAWNRRLSFTDGKEFANPLADRDAASMRVILTPRYRQVLDGLDLAVPVGVSYTHGNSSAVGPTFGADNGGDITLGLEGTYLNDWTVTMQYVHFYGDPGTPQNSNQQQQYKQALADRDFLTLSVRTTF